MRANGQSIVQIARILGVHPATLYPQLSIEPDQPQLAGAS
jgi:transposase-like protein